MPEFPSNNLVLGGLVACAVGVLGILYLLRRDRRKFTQVGEGSKLCVHPMKSCRDLEVSQAECVALGIKSDGVMDRTIMAGAGAPIRYVLTTDTTLKVVGEHTAGGMNTQLLAAIEIKEEEGNVSTEDIKKLFKDFIQTHPGVFKYSNIILEGRNEQGQMVQVYRDPQPPQQGCGII